MIQDKIKTYTLLIFSIFGYFQSVYAQKDSIFVVFNTNDQAVIRHRVSHKQNLLAIARMYQIDQNEIRKANKISSDLVKENQILEISFTADLVSQDPDPSVQRLAIYYHPLPKDRIFHVISRELGLSWKKIKLINPEIESKNQKTNLILLGWISFNSPSDQLKTEPKINVPEAITTHKIESETVDSEDKSVLPFTFKFMHRGLAYCEKDFKASGRFYALHPDAEINSIVELSNPITGRKVYAKVIGRIPNVYPRDADVIVTREVARELGCLDKRFFIEVKYGQ